MLTYDVFENTLTSCLKSLVQILSIVCYLLLVSGERFMREDTNNSDISPPKVFLEI